MTDQPKLISTKPTPIPRHGVMNTGKVLVGLRYEPPRRNAVSRDMEWLQSSLINPPRRIDYPMLVYLIVLLAALLVFFSR